MPKRKPATWDEFCHLVASMQAVNAAFAHSVDPGAQRMAEPLARGLRRCCELIEAGPDAPWPPGLLSGVRQGARELDVVLGMLPAAEQSAARAAALAAGGAWLQRLLAGGPARVRRILKRGQIRTEDEYHLVRSYIDELEGQEPRPEELAACYRLVDDFSVATGEPPSGDAA